MLRAIDWPMRGLADAGRPDEAEDRAGDVALQDAHREELEDALLDVLQPVVVLVEDARGRAGCRSCPR